MKPHKQVFHREDLARRDASPQGAPVIRSIVAQHVEEAAHLWRLRRTLSAAPHVGLHALRRHDDRLAAHVDGVVVAGVAGHELADEYRDPDRAERSFVPAVVAIGARDWDGFADLVNVHAGRPDGFAVLEGALAWMSANELKGFVIALLHASSADARRLGLIACAAHDVDPKGALDAALAGDDDALRICALDVAARLGRIDRCDACVELAEGDDSVSLSAARAAVLLGDRHRALARLHAHVVATAHAPEAWGHLVLKVLPSSEARSVLQAWKQWSGSDRRVIRAVGVLGDSNYVQWLVDRMAERPFARVAGEAFMLLTGADLSSEPLRAPAPQSAIGLDGDADIAPERDADDDLPWPDVAGVRDWWAANATRFATGRRHLVGGALDEAGVARVLATGTQRQRAHAAEYRTLMLPGSPLFDVAAPAWRQQRLLGLR